MPKHVFTEDERSRGGAEARYLERVKGVKLNHGWRFGKKEKTEKEKHDLPPLRKR